MSWDILPSMSLPLMRSLIALVAAALLSAMLVMPAHADEPTPTDVQPSWHFLPDSFAYGTLENAPGMNDWNCKPTAERPRPVILVHGTLGAQASNWGSYSIAFRNAGYCVFALTYGEFRGPGNFSIRFGGLTDLRKSAAELRTFVDRVRAATGAAKVDLVGHSQGGLVSAYFLKNLGGAGSVEHAVSLSSPFQGVLKGVMPLFFMNLGMWALSALLPSYTSLFQMTTGSDFIKQLNRGGVPVPGPKYVNITTRYDEIAFPHEANLMPPTPGTDVTNVRIQDYCSNDYSEHLAIAADPNVFWLMDNVLTPATATPIQCRKVLFILGVVDK